MKVLVVDADDLGNRIGDAFDAAGCDVSGRSQLTEETETYDLILIHSGMESLCTQEELRAARVYHYSTAGGRSAGPDWFRRSIGKYGVTPSEAVEFVRWLKGEMTDRTPSLLGGSHPDLDTFRDFSFWIAHAQARQAFGTVPPPLPLETLQARIPGYGMANTAKLLAQLRAERIPNESLVDAALNELGALVATLNGSGAD